MLKIEFEGTDGAGKTTAMKYFITQAKAQGLSIVETREVGNPNVPSCVRLRELVLNPESNLSGEAMEMIFCAMRFENDKWLKELSDSKDSPDFVVSDRGYFSHLAYTDHNVSKDFTEDLYTNFIENATSMPNIVIYFEVDTETALKRRVSRGTSDVIEAKGVEFQELVRDSFVTHLNQKASNFSHIRLFRVDANKSIENVQWELDVILATIQAENKKAPVEKLYGGLLNSN